MTSYSHLVALVRAALFERQAQHLEGAWHELQCEEVLPEVFCERLAKVILGMLPKTHDGYAIIRSLWTHHQLVLARGSNRRLVSAHPAEGALQTCQSHQQSHPCFSHNGEAVLLRAKNLEQRR